MPLSLLLALSLLARADEPRRDVSAPAEQTQDRAAEFQAQAAAKRAQAILRLKELIKDTPPGELRAEMMLRLAELYAEEARYLYMLCMEAGGADCGDSARLRESAVTIYQRVVSEYPSFARADEALYFLGAELTELGRREEAAKAWTEMVRLYPRSVKASAAYLQIGEYYFDAGEPYKALMAYDNAARDSAFELKDYALFKRAWCYYNLGEYRPAIDDARAVAESSRSGGSALYEDSLDALVRFYADLAFTEPAALDEALREIARLGSPERIDPLLGKLAEHFLAAGDRDRAILAYGKLIARDPGGAAAPGYQGAIAAAYAAGGKHDQAIDALARMRRDYGPGSAWRAAASPQAAADADALRESQTRKLAIDIHQQAAKGASNPQRARQMLALADGLYATFLADFPQSEHTYDMRYAYGELLYKLGRYGEAYDQYAAVVALDPNGRHSQFCSRAMIFAAEELVKAEGETPGAWTDAEGRLLAAIDGHSARFPGGPEAQPLLYRAAYLAYENDRLRDASERFRAVIALNPGSREAEQAAHLILDSLSQAEDWETLAAVSLAFHDQKGLGSAAFKAEVLDIHQRSLFKRAEGLAASDPAAAGAQLLAFAERFPGSELAPQALNNAAVYLHKGGQLAAAMQARERLLAAHPGSRYAPDQLAAQGYAYENLADFARAADHYERLFQVAPQHPLAADALYSAWLFRRAQGQVDAAAAAARSFRAAFAADPRAAALGVELGALYAGAGRHADAAAAFRAVFADKSAGLDEQMQARLGYGQALLAQGKAAEAARHWTESLDSWAQSSEGAGPVAIDAAAQMRYLQARPLLDRYYALRIEGPARDLPQREYDPVLKKSFTAKSKARDEALAAMKALGETGSPAWLLAAYQEQGQILEDMAAALLSSPVPHYLTPEQKEIYEDGLEDQAYALRERAKESYSLALEKAFEWELYTEHTALALRHLQALDPQEYPGLSEEIMRAAYLDDSGGYGVGALGPVQE